MYLPLPGWHLYRSWGVTDRFDCVGIPPIDAPRPSARLLDSREIRGNDTEQPLVDDDHIVTEAFSPSHSSLTDRCQAQPQRVGTSRCDRRHSRRMCQGSLGQSAPRLSARNQ